MQCVYLSFALLAIFIIISIFFKKNIIFKIIMILIFWKNIRLKSKSCLHSQNFLFASYSNFKILNSINLPINKVRSKFIDDFNKIDFYTDSKWIWIKRFENRDQDEISKLKNSLQSSDLWYLFHLFAQIKHCNPMK